MKLFTKEIEERLRRNQRIAEETGDSTPVVCKIFNPYNAGTWLLSEMDEDGHCFGLCDLGVGFPELGYVSRYELESVGYLERDLYWKPSKTMMEYADEARECGRIRA